MIAMNYVKFIGICLMFFIFFILKKYSKYLTKKNEHKKSLTALSKVIAFLGVFALLLALGEDIRIVIAVPVFTFIILLIVHIKHGFFSSVLLSFLQVLSAPAAIIWRVLTFFVKDAQDANLSSVDATEDGRQMLRQMKK